MTIALGDIINRHVAALEAFGKIGMSLQAHNGVPIALLRHLIDQVNQPVFQSADT